MGGGTTPWRGGPDQQRPWGPGMGSAVGGAVYCQGGHQSRLPQRYSAGQGFLFALFFFFLRVIFIIGVNNMCI